MAQLRYCISQSFALPPATKPVNYLPCPLPPNHSVICLAPCHQTTQSFALPLPPNHSVICLAPCHQTSQSFDLPSTTATPHHHGDNREWMMAPPRHHISQSFALAPATKPLSHLPCPLPPNHSVICLAPCHQTTQSFALAPATKPVSHLTCPLPPWHCSHCVTASLWHCDTASPWHSDTMSPHHCITASPCQSFDLPVSHLTCPLPLHHCSTMAQWHRITTSPWHHVTVSLHQSFDLPSTTATPQHHIFPTTWVWIWLVYTTQHSSDWLIVPTTANQITGIEKPNYHKTLIFFPTTSLKRSHGARIDELADSNEPAINFTSDTNVSTIIMLQWSLHVFLTLILSCVSD